jgi:hypothetical protein
MRKDHKIMKTILGIFLLLSSLTTFAQFPVPTNFDFNYDYIMIDQSGYCAGQWVDGPTYCSHFSWAVPDTNSTNSILEFYNLYYYAYGSEDTTILTSVIDTYFDMEIGIMGEIWVTAVYSNPEGESEPSNKIINEDLPISIDENILQKDLNVFYDSKQQEIIIENGKGITKINLFDSQGKLIQSQKSINERINIGNLQKGLYVIEIFLENQDVKRQKIVK